MRHPPSPIARRTRALLGALLLGPVAGAAAGCADVEGLRDDGDLGEVHAPQALWKGIRPEPPGPGQRPGQPTPVPGLPTVPSGGVKAAGVLEVVRADLTAAGRQDGGTGRLVDPRAVRRLAPCPAGGDPGPDCPVRPAVFHDLTEDGVPEMITAVDIDGRLSELRVYTVREGRVTRVLSRRAVLEGVEVAAGHLAVREPTSNPELVAISDYVWDPDKGGMVLEAVTVDDCPSVKESAKPCPQSEI
ncbi:hypothetical protein [Streptomyces sp. NPDC097619]|uniref:hypothetical protein n=1 Tax=Streptomyces sp. NPDC097619 TaxID=3157228 RepID=UPI003319E427